VVKKKKPLLLLRLLKPLCLLLKLLLPHRLPKLCLLLKLRLLRLLTLLPLLPLLPSNSLLAVREAGLRVGFFYGVQEGAFFCIHAN
jgi:hypothetical protein